MSISGLRQLRRDGDDRRGALHPGPVRHRRAGGLRPAAPPELPPDGHLPRLFLRSGAGLLRERQGEGTACCTATVIPNNSLQWVPEIAHHCAKTPFLLVGTQIDLRDDPLMLEKLAKNKQKPVSFDVGEKLAKELKAVKYVECSALTQAGDPLLELAEGNQAVAEGPEERVRRGHLGRAGAADAREEEEVPHPMRDIDFLTMPITVLLAKLVPCSSSCSSLDSSSCLGLSSILL